jgi:putative hydrolase of the HAD superfamily
MRFVKYFLIFIFITTKRQLFPLLKDLKPALQNDTDTLLLSVNISPLSMKTTKYRHIFFDLDKTLWDFDTNSLETFRDLFKTYGLKRRGIESAEKFHTVYEFHNLALWEIYRQGKIEKADLNVKRFTLALEEYGIKDYELGRKMAMDYIHLSPTKTNLFPDTHRVLEYLKARYSLHIITNGFEEVQFRKLHHSSLSKYFTEVITSEDAGVKKPDPEIFNYALKRAGAGVTDSLMVGDDEEVDIAGAGGLGIDQVLVDFQNMVPGSKATYRIRSLDELTAIL